MVEKTEEAEKTDEPIYERLAAGECLILSKHADKGLLVARNENGQIHVAWVPCPS